MSDDAPPEFVPTSKRDVQDMVRAVTDYDERTLSQTTLDKHIEIAKTVLYTRTSSDAFYTDAGLGQALVFATALLVKAAVENYSVTRWNIGDQYIDAGTDGTSDQQLQQWNSYVREGIRRSDETPTGPRNSADYIG